MSDIIKYSKLNKQGYIIPKLYLSESQLESIQNDLTVEPEIDKRFKILCTNEAFNIYLETIKGDKIVLP